MGIIVDDDVIRLAKWHENEAVRLRKHPDADMASAHGLAEIHGGTASVLYMLLADRNSAIMDADMQAREAGNMEHNARVLMTERNQERADREEWMRQHAALDELCTRREAERDQLREAVEALMAADDYWLRGNKDNQWASMMAAARAKARIALGKDR
jgi:hypothetical protein